MRLGFNTVFAGGARAAIAPLALALALALLLALPAPLLAQGASGSITGEVRDAQGGPLPGVAVTVKNTATGSVRTAATRADGSWAFPVLPVGRYDVSAEMQGFAAAKRAGVVLNVGGDVTIPFSLAISAVAAQATVTGEAPLIETTRTQVSSVVDQNLVANLPTNGRNFIDFVLTTPGVVRDVRGGDISFAGQRGTLNSLVVDGADNNNTFFGQTLGRTGSGRAPYQFSQDAVQEFQVNTNAYSAEYGRAGGAVINVVTKSGTNEFHGSAFYFYRDRSLRANDYIDEINNRDKAPYGYDQFGASLGGPIVKDQVFFFANYDGQRNTIPNTVVLGVPNGGYPTDPASQAGLAQLQALGSSWERRQDQDVYLLKGDAELGGAGRLSVRYNHQKFTGKNFENGGLTNAAEHTGNSLVTTDTLTASLATTVSPTLVNEFRAQYAMDKEPGEANSANPEAVVGQGGTTVLTIGRNNFSPRETTITRYQFADAMTFLLPKHTLKAGFDFNRDLILNYFPGNFSGSYTFNSLAAFNSGRPDLYLQAFPGPGTTGAETHPDQTELGIFVQDEFRPASGLTLNLGIRYDRGWVKQGNVQNPDPQLAAAGIDTTAIPEGTNQVAVRLGFAWTPRSDGRTVVRGGYGGFYGRTPSIMFGTALSNNGINVQTLTFSGASAPTYPQIFPVPPGGGTAQKPSIFYFDPNYKNPLVHQASLGVEQGITPDLSVAATYQYVKGTHLQRTIDVNVGAFTTTTFTNDKGETFDLPVYSPTRPFSNFARVLAFQDTAESNYNGLTLELNKRYSNHWQARLAWTYSKVMDTKPDATAVVPGTDDSKFAQDPLNLQGDYAPGANDVTHRVVLSGVWSLDYFDGSDFLTKWVLSGWAVSGIFSYSTGQPYTPTVAAGAGLSPDLNNDGNRSNDRAPGWGRNSFRLPAQVSLDPRISKTFGFGPVRLELIAEAFNLLNNSNVSGVRTVYYSYNAVGGKPTLVTQAAFGTPTASSGPRTIQLAAKIVF
jgi:hypothetical protein